MRLSTLSLLAVILIGAALRFAALGADVRFHVDEALFATFARNAAVNGDWMLSGALDKPPLSLYASALAMHFTGVHVNASGVLDLDLKAGEFAARLPGALAGIVTIALTYALARRLKAGRRAAVGAAALTAFSPLLVGVSPTAFTDPLLLMFGLAAGGAAAAGRAAASGLLLALAVASKQQGVFVIPLAVALLWTAASGRRQRTLTAFTAALAAGVAVLLAWDAARPETSVFALASANNDPQRLLPDAAELLPRLVAWLDVLGAGFGTVWLALGLLAAALVGMWRSRRLAIIGAYAALYFAAHWLLPFNLYDRYLLPLIPLTAVAAAAGLDTLPRRAFVPALTALCVLLLAAQAPFPQDNRWRDDNVIALADTVNAHPLGTIVYDHWSGWHLGYYLGVWSDKRRVYYPDPDIQAQDALRNPERAPRLLVAPREVDAAPWLDALRAAGFEVWLEYENPRFRLYGLLSPASGA
jgi:4-amino-4-deoxy-L-arabinose transferase-like glycosyltransferase